MQHSLKATPRTLLLAGAMATLLGAAACNPTTIEPVTDPNNASLESVAANATPVQLNALATGLEATLRLGHNNNGAYNQMAGTLGREIIILASNEPRWYTEILGSKSTLDNAAFYSVASYNSFARVIRAANVMRQSTAGTNAVTAEQKQGIYGFADTYEALGKLHLLNLMGENGIRIDVADYLKPGKFTAGSAPALANIRKLLDDGATKLGAAGSAFSFNLSSGYAGFNTPATFLRFNRALAARVALYQKDYAGAKTALAASFYNPAGSLTLGPKITFNPGAAGDAGNPYFQVPNSGPSTLVTVPINFVNEAEAGDLRLSKATLRTAPRTLGGITGAYDPAVYTAQTAPLAIIRNEELILISAEAKANTGDILGALVDINTIRTRSGGLLPYAGAVSVADLTDEILRQRRYSLFYEGHIWVDLRRLNKLNPTPAPRFTLPLSSGTYKLFDRLEKPFAEIAWDSAN